MRQCTRWNSGSYPIMSFIGYDRRPRWLSLNTLHPEQSTLYPFPRAAGMNPFLTPQVVLVLTFPPRCGDEPRVETGAHVLLVLPPALRG